MGEERGDLWGFERVSGLQGGKSQGDNCVPAWVKVEKVKRGEGVIFLGGYWEPIEKEIQGEYPKSKVLVYIKG